jgi:hypothetical protein
MWLMLMCTLMEARIVKPFMLVLHMMFVRIRGVKISGIQMLIFSCMVAGYYCFGYVDFIGPYSLGVVGLVVLFSVSFSNYCIRADLTIPNPHVTISVVLTLLALWLYFVYGVPFIRLQKMIVVPIVMIFAIKGSIISMRQMNNALLVIAVIVSVSCVFAVFQAFDIDFFWDIRMMLGSAGRSVIEYQLLHRIKAPGLAYFSVPLSYQISAIFPFAIYLTCISTTRRKSVMILGLLLVLGALASQSLSSVLSILVSFTVFMKLNRLLSQRRLIVFIIVLTLVAIGFTSVNGLLTRVITPDHTILCRIPFTLIGIKVLLSAPLGVGGYELLDLMRYYYLDYQFISGARDIFEFGFHNCMLTFGVNYGWAALLVYIWIYLYIFRLIYKPMKKSAIGSADHYFYSGAIAYFCAYIIQSCTHSSGLVIGDPYDWIIIGVILAYKPL